MKTANLQTQQRTEWIILAFAFPAESGPHLLTPECTGIDEKNDGYWENGGLKRSLPCG